MVEDKIAQIKELKKALIVNRESYQVNITAAVALMKDKAAIQKEISEIEAELYS